MGVNIDANDTLPLLVISLAMTIAVITLSLWGGIQSFYYTQSNPQSNTQYFQFNAVFSNLFNSISCFCVSIYLVWLTVYPLEDTDFFLTHGSIRMRIATTVCWYLGKIFLFLIFNGRLYYAFRNSKYRSNYVLFKSLNVFVIIHAIISLIVGYLGVLTLRNEIVANIGFNTFHIDLTILLFYLSFQFNRRMFHLSTTRVKIEMSRSHGDPNEHSEYSSFTGAQTRTDVPENGHHIAPIEEEDEGAYEEEEDEVQLTTKNAYTAVKSQSNKPRRDVVERENHRDESGNKSYRRRVFREGSIVNNREFLRIVTRSSLLLTIIIPFMISISLTWTIHRFALNTTHYSMCWALLVMALDCFVNVICVLLLFKYADPMYNALCKCVYINCECTVCSMDYCCTRCCVILARKYHDQQ
eukprot:348608_1